MMGIRERAFAPIVKPPRGPRASRPLLRHLDPSLDLSAEVQITSLETGEHRRAAGGGRTEPHEATQQQGLAAQELPAAAVAVATTQIAPASSSRAPS